MTKLNEWRKYWRVNRDATLIMSAKSGKLDHTRYNFGAIFSLVLTADRSVLRGRDKEPDGAPTSLAGRIDPKEMGSRAIRTKSPRKKS